MKKLSYAIAFILCYRMMNAQSKNVDSFNSIEVFGSIFAELTQSNDEGVKYKITKGDEKNLVIMNKGNSLIVKTKGDQNRRSKTAANVKIYYKFNEYLEVNSGSSVFAKGMIKADKFDLEVSIGSSCTITFSTDFIDVEISSGSMLTLYEEQILQI